MNSSTSAPNTASGTGTAVASTTRSRQVSRPDPAAVWAPLAGLADAAANTANGSAVVAVNRGFDRKARQRARALNELLDDRGVRTIEVTPAPDSERLLGDATVCAVVNLVGAGSWQPYRIAAKTRAPVLTPRPTDERSEQDGTEVVQRDVIGMAGQEGERDVALTRIVVLPEDAEQAGITVSRDGEPLSIPGGRLTITPREGQLAIHLEGPDFAEQTFTTTELGLETYGGAHRLIRDELPIAEFEGSLAFSSEPAGLVVRPV